MGKVDDLRAMREARYAAATRPARAVPAGGRPARHQTAVAPTGPGADPRPGAAKPASGGKAAKTGKPALRVVTDEETTAAHTSGESALFAVSDGNAKTEPCGHRAISGKTCIRETGHAEKNHRYAKS